MCHIDKNSQAVDNQVYEVIGYTPMSTLVTGRLRLIPD